MRFKICFFYSISILLLLNGCTSPTTESKLRVAVAASLEDVMEELTPIFENQYDIKVETVYGGSGKLARQIEQGAPVDVYLSADDDWVKVLQDKGLVENDTYIEFATNQLVMIGAKQAQNLESIQKLKDLQPSTQIAIGNPSSVPAGTYTEQALKKIHIWDEIAGQFVFGGDVRQVLAYVESGQVNYGIVYASDALISDQVVLNSEIDTALHDPIHYPGILISDSRSKEQGRHFLNFLLSEQTTEIYKSYGFNPTRGGEID
ncbi:molybdate transport system substrate-binding protein [Halobacillus karajensis]|uniref:Molybdate-binding periplasmic protein n=1 Tax=Halobacillus karajensis TaxID=195088 RepID=A0A059NXP0_9BACI|nr:molybdate ABC transporter substrate-binding protein [Halobacillus karajensis]CDQ18373.1 Molybdate-binding periplasmic protein precursor [Halobacillus karajensis]CDQ23555.1 Molybdate-binding periplasmic protein precursor [Halobacillus karajensis]CDQ27037.1 Molybdate-binding periplasmic protein precursor [Halobacillus karajensis]SEH52354.1 molybdate transport system substrate-binding protein [Halobacillus karajensis]